MNESRELGQVAREAFYKLQRERLSSTDEERWQAAAEAVIEAVGASYDEIRRMEIAPKDRRIAELESDLATAYENYNEVEGAMLRMKWHIAALEEAAEVADDYEDWRIAIRNEALGEAATELDIRADREDGITHSGGHAAADIVRALKERT